MKRGVIGYSKRLVTFDWTLLQRGAQLTPALLYLKLLFRNRLAGRIRRLAPEDGQTARAEKSWIGQSPVIGQDARAFRPYQAAKFFCT